MQAAQKETLNKTCERGTPFGLDISSLFENGIQDHSGKRIRSLGLHSVDPIDHSLMTEGHDTSVHAPRVEIF